MRFQALACLMVALAASAGPVGAQSGPAVMTQDPAPPSADPALSRLEQAQLNYLAISNGQRDLTQLSRQELADVIELDRRVRAQRRDERSPRQRCLDDELDSLDRAPSRLALRAIELKCSQR
jgi:hypothetical protein